MESIIIQQKFISQKKKIILKDNLKYVKVIEKDHNKLQVIIDNLCGKVDKIIETYENDFMIAYKEQKTEIQKELNAMKEILIQYLLNSDTLSTELLRTIEELRLN
ncbi:unnamed protein product (macronuclear) [Paramecium tetraurelia]|uniref:Uncharacterized protein n=1 Tax=Paramecium tetraurelia TaxID=5888 RepID=A0BE86_PARTE|nr:uncharacterized protein GSPATT00027886001 [Paramecium tetraurelia]CAK56853.1 unnamed protein product [Paramecium tetraurelia]|eukprot:XP_001424251.1 hypothetical protein (macronuclear) [Paramecium tetraurelia strain d4-2]